MDGASRGNPGPASIGVVFQNEKTGDARCLSKRIGVTTNNVAEYSALLFAMQEALVLGLKELNIFTDSELLAKQFSGEYRVKDPLLKLLSLFVTHLGRAFRELRVTHVPREENVLADREANRALDQESFL